MKYRNDEWVLTDSYGLGGAGDTLARIVLEAEAPFTVAVTGKWGAGKTSVMRRAFATLGGQPVSQALPMGSEKQEGKQSDWDALHHTKRQAELHWEASLQETAEQSMCIWYSPWQHQNEPNPIIPLLLELKQQFTPLKRLKDFNRQAGLAAATLLERTIDAALSLSAGRTVKLATGTTEAVRKVWMDGDAKHSVLSDGQRFHLLFEDAVETILDGAKRDGEKELSADARLIIFIDDLDRCEEQAVVALLEAIKLYLGTQRCLFVLGIDDTALLGALSRVWKERSEDDNREYLEKILQTTLPVPLPRPKSVTDAIAEQLAHHDFPAAEACAKKIEALLEPNPRKIKNFTNSLCSCWSLFQLKDQAQTDAARAIHFIMFHYLRLYHRPIWRLLERQPIAQKLLYEVLRRTNVLLTEEIKGFENNLQEQRMMVSFMQQAFSHVLKQQGEESDQTTHHGEKLEDAIRRFQHRQDRKRSDEVFTTWFSTNESNNAPLDDAYLYLPELSMEPSE